MYLNKKKDKPKEKKLDARKKVSTEIDKLSDKYNWLLFKKNLRVKKQYGSA